MGFAYTLKVIHQILTARQDRLPRTNRGNHPMKVCSARHQKLLEQRPPAALAQAALALTLCGCLLLGGCASQGPGVADGPSGSDNLDPDKIPDAVPRVEPRSKSGNMKTYVVRGKRYYTEDDSRGHVERGMASWYGKKFHGRNTSSGERYDMYAMTAAHKTLPLPSYVRVTNVDSGRSAVVRVNDRGPFHGPRIIDLSYAAATKIGVVSNGTALVEVRAIDPARPGADPGPGPFLAANPSQSKKKTAVPVARPANRCGAPRRSSSRRIRSRRSNRCRVRMANRERAVGAAMAALESKPMPSIGKPVEVEAPTATPSRSVAQASPSAKPNTAVSAPPAIASEATAAAAAGVGKAAGQGLYLQVGAFGDRNNAERLAQRLTKQLTEGVLVQRPATSSAGSVQGPGRSLGGG